MSEGASPTAPTRDEGAAPPPAARRPSRLRRLPAVRRPSAPLAVLLVVTLLQGLAWAIATAPLTGPDEANHVAYVQSLAETGHGPSTLTGTGSYSTQLETALEALGLGPILGHVEGRPSWSRFAAVEGQLKRLPADDGSGPNAVANNPPLYYAMEAVVYRLSPFGSLLGRLAVMRLLSVGLFVLTVGLAWLIACELFAATWLRTLVCALVALQPKMAFMCSSVNPDVLLFCVSTACLLAGLRVARRPSARNLLALGVLTGLGPLTHGRGFFLVGVAAIAGAIAWRGARPPLGRLARGAALVVGPLLVLVAGSFLYTRGHAAGAFGGEVGRAAEQHASLSEFLSYVYQFYFGPLPSLASTIGKGYGYRQFYVETFYGSFSALEVNYSDRVYDLLQVGSAIGLALLGAAIVARWEAVKRQWRPIAVLGGGALCNIGLLQVSAYRDLQVGGDPLITGRYLLPTVAVWAVVIAWVARSLPPRVGPLLGGFVLGVFVLLDASGLGLEAGRFLA